MEVQDITDHFFIKSPEIPAYSAYQKILERNGLFALLEPETSIEAEFITRPEVIEGLMWGLPRYGHPEGKVAYHIKEVFNNINNLRNEDADTRTMLRIIALIHDTFKYQEDRNVPRDWTKHHGVLARKYLENQNLSFELCEITEMHDEAFYAWRAAVVEKNQELSDSRLKRLENRIPNHLNEYFLFFLCDTLTGDKLRTPVKWLFEKAKTNGWF